MSSRRNQSPLIDELFEFLKAAPIWIGPLLALATYGFFRLGIPLVLAAWISNHVAANTIKHVLTPLSIQLSPLLGVGVLFIWGFAELNKRRVRQRLEKQSGLETIHDLSWMEFESLLSEAFRRQGFNVIYSGQSGPDGGIDLRLQKAGATTLVQCKHWKQWQVGVKVVRELLGIVSSEGAQSGIVVTSGKFTSDAIEFASRNPIRLVHGQELVAMLSKVQTSGRIRSAAPMAASQPAVASVRDANDAKCPKCGAAMVRRVAKTGQYAGLPFLGCSRFPACRGKRNLTIGTS